jgi:hypothetical protein
MRQLNYRRAFSAVLLFACFSATPYLHAQDKGDQNEDFDTYKLRVDAAWYYSRPTGTLHGANDTGSIDLNKDLHFQSYSTFSGRLDWKFTRKNHLYVGSIPLDASHQTVLNRTFTFRGKTFDAGLTANSSLDTLGVVVGYKYDIFRRKRWNLGVGVQFDLFDTTAKINAAAQTTGDGVHHAAVSASSSLFAGIPVAGPEFRVYLTNSPKLFVEANVNGMYFFGYGNFVSSRGDVGYAISKHFAATAGYQLGSDLTVNGTSDRLGLKLTQKGATVGVQASF